MKKLRQFLDFWIFLTLKNEHLSVKANFDAKAIFYFFTSDKIFKKKNNKNNA